MKQAKYSLVSPKIFDGSRAQDFIVRELRMDVLTLYCSSITEVHGTGLWRRAWFVMLYALVLFQKCFLTFAC